EHKPADIYQPILTNGGNNVNISGTTARTQMTHRAYLMFSLDPAWRDGIKTFLNFSLREHKPADIYQPILKSGGNNIIINGTTDGGTFNSGPSEKKRDR
ncbi:20967_t:CDS:1, partial [Rhizophagus irregularis]